jgi:hypothetical protein
MVTQRGPNTVGDHGNTTHLDGTLVKLDVYGLQVGGKLGQSHLLTTMLQDKTAESAYPLHYSTHNTGFLHMATPIFAVPSPKILGRGGGDSTSA